jgi:GT2 family glycosyltransferase/glycosyltransferase involved in cell wall biosynthesis
MSARELTVVLPVYNSFEHVQACLASLLDPHLDIAITSLLIVDDASDDPKIQPLLQQFEQRDSRIRIRRNPQNLGYLTSVNQALLDLEGAIILLNSDTCVGPGWASRMHSGAQRYPRLGALTPLSNNATFSTLPGFPGESEKAIDSHNFVEAERLIASRGKVDYPLAPTGMGFCLYLTPLAMRIARGFDPLFEPGYEEENDLCMRLRAHGLQCRIATDVLVFHEGGGSFGEAKRRLQEDHYNLIKKVHPTYDATVKEWFRLADTQTLLQQGFVDQRLNVLLDGEILGQTMTGVVRYATTMIDLCRAAVQADKLALAVVVNDEATATAWRAHYPDVDWLVWENLRDRPPSLNPEYHIYHVFNANISLERILVLRKHARRFVFTLHDLIAFENPSYWPSGEEFLAYRQRLRSISHLADRLLCISEITKAEALEQLAIQATAAEVFSNSLDHLKSTPRIEQPPECTSSPLVLIIGTDFRHKNLLESVRLFADALLDDPRQPRLVLAGPQVSEGGTLEAVKQLISEDPRLTSRVSLRGAVSDDELKDLYCQASCCLYLSLQEGFGYIPYEAATHGCPTLVANTSVYQSAPKSIALDPFSCTASRDALWGLLSDRSQRSDNLSYWLGRLQCDQQRQYAVELYDAYQRVLFHPRMPQSSFWADFIETNLLSSASLITYQLSFAESARHLARRGLSAVRRKAKSLINRFS